MKNISIENIREMSTRINKVEESINNININNDKLYKILREEILTHISSLREQIIIINLKFEQEQKKIIKRKAKTLQIFKSE